MPFGISLFVILNKVDKTCLVAVLGNYIAINVPAKFKHSFLVLLLTLLSLSSVSVREV